MDEEKGHNPTEDAVAALELAQYFIKAGPCQVTRHFVTHTRAHTHTDDIVFSVCTLPGCRAPLGEAVGLRGRREDF